MTTLERTKLEEMNHLMQKIIDGMKKGNRDLFDNREIVGTSRELSDMALKLSNYIVATYIEPLRDAE